MACSFCPGLIRKRRGEVRALLPMMLCMERTKPEGPRPRTALMKGGRHAGETGRPSRPTDSSEARMLRGDK